MMGGSAARLAFRFREGFAGTQSRVRSRLEAKHLVVKLQSFGVPVGEVEVDDDKNSKRNTWTGWDGDQILLSDPPPQA